jgi:hypothetical protein
MLSPNSKFRETRKILDCKITGNYYNSVHCHIFKTQRNPSECILTPTNFCCIHDTKKLLQVWLLTVGYGTKLVLILDFILAFYKPDHDWNLFKCFTFRILICVFVLRASALCVTSFGTDIVKLCRQWSCQNENKYTPHFNQLQISSWACL